MLQQSKNGLMACLLTAALTGCAQLVPLEPASPPSKTVAVTDTEVRLAGRLNQTLAGLGWALTGYQPASMAGLAPTSVPADLAERAWYRLELRAADVGVCPGALSSAYVYEYRFIDNRDGEVLLQRQGQGCEIQIADRFARRLRQLGLAPGADDES